MPLLKKEPDVFPPDLFERSEGEWFVVHVASRQEKVLARYAHDRGLSYFLPQIEKRSRRNGRTFVSYIPLFPGYLFLRGTREDRALALRSPVVARALEVRDQETLERELRQIWDLQLRGAAFIPYPDLAPGDPVTVTEGVFKGCRGVVLREKGELRLLVTVSLIRRSILVELSRNGIAPART